MAGILPFGAMFIELFFIFTVCATALVICYLCDRQSPMLKCIWCVKTERKSQDDCWHCLQMREMFSDKKKLEGQNVCFKGQHECKIF